MGTPHATYDLGSPPALALMRRILILGGGDVGSAVAHRLHLAQFEVLICERPSSTHLRRGMAFTDALFDGSALLEGVSAHWQSDVAAVCACWAEKSAIPMVTLPEAQLLESVRFDVIIDATMRRELLHADLRPLAPLTIGLGPGFAPGRNCHVAIETQWGESMGRVLRDVPAATRSGGPRKLDGVSRERFVFAEEPGQWHTHAQLGQCVAPGEVIGELAGQPIRAPIGGTLRGLARDGVAIAASGHLAEIDPRVTPEVNGLSERPLAIALGVMSVLGF